MPDVKPFRFRPFSEKQRRLILAALPGGELDRHDLLLADGAIRSGKTIACITAFVLFTGRFRHENFILAGKTLNSLARNVAGPMQRILTAMEVPFFVHKSEQKIVIGDNTIYLFGAYDEKSQDRLQGLTAAGALADEAALFPRSFVDQMIGRCSVPGARVFLNCNPSAASHYLKTEYIDRAEEKRILRLHFTLDDNPSLSPKIRERYERMYTGVFYRRFILGEWVQAEGLVYDLFGERNIADPPERPSEWAVSCDYGTQNATVFLLWGRVGGSWYAAEEYYYSGRDALRQKTDNEYRDDLLALAAGRPVSRMAVDPSAASFIALVRQTTPIPVVKAKNTVLDGIRAVSRALDEGRIFISPRCVHTLDEFAQYAWDARVDGIDRPRKEHDHAMDAVRYFVTTILNGGRGVHVLQ